MLDTNIKNTCSKYFVKKLKSEDYAIHIWTVPETQRLNSIWLQLKNEARQSCLYQCAGYILCVKVNEGLLREARCFV